MVAAFTGLTLLSLTAVLVSRETAGAASYSYTPDAIDYFSRSVGGGLGAAATGGSWHVHGADGQVSVAKVGGATVAGLRPGQGMSAQLDGVSERNEQVQVVFSLPTLPTAGNGTTVSAQLRVQDNGDVYLARVRVGVGGSLYLSIVKETRAGETTLESRLLNGSLQAGQLVILQGLAFGSGDVEVRAWVPGSGIPQWEKGVDNDPSALAGAGAVGFQLYQSQISPVTDVHILQFW